MAQTLFAGSILSLPAEGAERLLKADDGDAALLYLHLLRNVANPTPQNWDAARAQRALDVLIRLHMAPAGTTAPSPVAPAPPIAPLPAEIPAPTYSVEEITCALGETESPFTFLADEVERQLGKKLNATDLKILYTLYDHLALPLEVILLLVSWCIEEHERKYGKGRRPFLSHIRREGFIWARQGVETAEAAEEHLKKLNFLRSREGALLQILDLPPRPLVSREQSYLASWLDMGFDDETLRIAFEKTVMKKGSLDWTYLNGILRRWHEKGLHTAAAVASGDRDTVLRAGQGGAPTVASTGADDGSTRADMDRMRRIIDQMKQEDG